MYQDSFGNILPAAADTLALGIYPPPIQPTANPGSPGTPGGGQPDACTGTPTYVSAGYAQPNILMIMVDQMRSHTLWPPSAGQGGQNAINALIPNIAQLQYHSYIFPNYFVAATACSPSRATLLTGLYSYQTCMFKSQDAPGANGSPYPPSLQPYAEQTSGPFQGMVTGFPTIANVLGQQLPIGTQQGAPLSTPYDCVWIGKWHLSDNGNEPTCNPGGNGASVYGFTDLYSIPNSSVNNPYGFGQVYPSPNGAQNEGNGGHFLDGGVPGPDTADPGQTYASLSPTFPAGEGLTAPGYLQLNDAAIAYAFSKWLPNAPAASPWFAAVSFVNPHDMSQFPYSYALAPLYNSQNNCPSNGDFCGAPSPSPSGFLPPPTGTQGVGEGPFESTVCSANDNCNPLANESFPSLDPNLYTAAPGGWNNLDDPSLQPYTYQQRHGGGSVKPGLQTFFQSARAQQCGSVSSNPAGWLTFLNYYFWMQSCVDQQIGSVITSLFNSPFWNNTVIIFHSDHGDYGGSHNLHSKAGALYDECISVPLYISLPQQRPQATYNSSNPEDYTNITLPYVCSSVDILPFIYTMALGNDSWRNYSCDLVYYLRTREAIRDAIYSSQQPTQQRRVSSIPDMNPFGSQNWQKYQPYVLHTTDEFEQATVGGLPQPSHAIAFRTVDLTGNLSGSYGGGKLGIYSYWQPCSITPYAFDASGNPSQAEFYNYSPQFSGQSLVPNPAEIGNQGVSSIDQTTGVTSLAPEAANYQTSFDAIAQTELFDPPSQPYIQDGFTLALDLYLAYLAAITNQTGCDTQPVCTQG